MDSKNDKNDENSSSSFSDRVKYHKDRRLEPFQESLQGKQELHQRSKTVLISELESHNKSWLKRIKSFLPGNQEQKEQHIKLTQLGKKKDQESINKTEEIVEKYAKELKEAENRLRKEENSFRGALSDRGHALYDMVKANLEAAWRSIVQGFTSLMGSGNTITVPNEEQDSVPSNSLSIEGGQNSDEKIMAYLRLNYPELKCSGKKGIEKLVENLRTSVLQINNDNGAEDESKDRISRAAKKLGIEEWNHEDFKNWVKSQDTVTIHTTRDDQDNSSPTLG